LVKSTSGGDRLIAADHQPSGIARVCVETGEQLFSPETVERLQKTIWQNQQPKRVIETPVFDFSD